MSSGASGSALRHLMLEHLHLSTLKNDHQDGLKIQHLRLIKGQSGIIIYVAGILQSSPERCDMLGTSRLLSRTLTVFISLRVNLAVPWLSMLPAYFLCMSSEEINLTEILRTCSFISCLSLLCSGCLPQNNEPLFLVCSGEECGHGLHTTSISVVANYGASRIFSYP